MKKTALYDVHLKLGAKMMAFAGFEMPIQYDSIIDEHLSVRNQLGIFDVSHMGEFIIRGKEALKLVQHISSNDASKLKSGQAQYAYLPNDDGGIVDDLLIYRLFDDQCSEGEQAFMLVVNASNIQKDWDWIWSKNSYDCKLIDISDKTSLFAVQGPQAANFLQTLVNIPLGKIDYYDFVKTEVAGLKNVLVSATGYTGSGGFELYLANNQAKELWEKMLSKPGARAVGLGARDTLRLEMGYCLYGNDIDENTSPLEAGLSWITKLNKEEDFSSKQILIEEKKKGITKKLVGFVMDGKRVPRKSYVILSEKKEVIGEVTSGNYSPSLGIPLGLGYVHKEFSKAKTRVFLDTGRKLLSATITRFPAVQIQKL